MTVPTIGPSIVPIPPMMTIKIIVTTQFKSKPVVTVMNKAAIKLMPPVNQSHHTFSETREIETPAGRFNNCIRIETQAKYEGGMYARKKQNLQLTYMDWYAPNVGLIKTVSLEGGPTGPEMDRVELVRFNVTPAAQTH